MKLQFFLLIITTYCCFSESKKQQVVIERNYPGLYSEGSIKLEPECPNLRYTPDLKAIPDFRKTDPCVNMIPGLSSLEHGYIENFFHESFQEYTTKQYDKVFYFTCKTNPKENTKLYKNYKVPSEIGSILPIKEIKMDKRVLSNITIMNEFENDAGFKKFGNRFLLSLPLRRSELETIGSAGYIGIKNRDFQVRLHTNTQPNQHVLQKYTKLPDNWSQDVNGYYEFIMQFGTHLRVLTTFGGSLMLLISERTNKINIRSFDLDDIIKTAGFSTQVINIKKDDNITIRLLVLGGISSSKDSTDWIKSLEREPVPVNSMNIPLNEFLDKSNSSRSQSLARLITFEKYHQVFKKYSYQLELLHHENELSRFVKSKLSEQLRYICSSEYLYMVIKEGIEAQNNMKLDKFFLKFTTNETSHNNSLVIYKNTISLIPKVCFIFRKKINDCSEPSLQLPPKIKCLQFFESQNCFGKGIKLYEANGLRTILLNFNVMSMMFCDQNTD